MLCCFKANYCVTAVIEKLTIQFIKVNRFYILIRENTDFPLIKQSEMYLSYFIVQESICSMKDIYVFNTHSDG